MGLLNEWGRRALTVGLVFGMLTSAMGCSALGLSEDEEDNTLLYAAAAYLLTRSSSLSIDSSTGCISGIATSLDSALPTWIKNNFKCQTVTVSGGNYVFKTVGYPNYKSYYWGSSSSLYEALPSGHTAAGNNLISAQNVTLTITSTPNTTVTATSTGVMGVATNGVIIYNNAANAPDTLSDEALTFDSYGGHPQNAGQYHYHAEPDYLSDNNSNMIGIALDGYFIFGKKCDNGTAATGDDYTPTAPSGSPVGTGLDVRHGHTTATQHFTSRYHYHLALDGTAGIDTLIGDNFQGSKGTATQ